MVSGIRKLALFLVFIPFLTALQQQESSQPEDPGKAAIDAYNAGDYVAYLQNLIKVREKYPYNPGVLAQVARAYALNDRVDESLNVLRTIVAMGGTTDLEHKDLARLKGLKPLQQIARAFERNRRPQNRSRVAFSIEERDLIPEGMAYDDQEKAFYVGSIHRNKIVRVTKDGVTEDLIAEGRDGIAEVLGMKVDSARRVLWVCASRGRSAGQAERTSAVFKYDLRSRQLVKRYDNRLPGKHLFNDIAPAKSGDVFLTDSEGRSVLKISRATDDLAVLIPAGSFAYPNGIALAHDERHLFIADQRGIHRFSLAGGKLELIKQPETMSLAGIDGLYLWNRQYLVGVQNGFSPERTIRVRLNESLDTATELQVLESSHKLFDIPTTGAVVGRDFYFIANSQLDHLDDKGGLVDADKLQKPVILVTPLGG